MPEYIIEQQCVHGYIPFFIAASVIICFGELGDGSRFSAYILKLMQMYKQLKIIYKITPHCFDDVQCVINEIDSETNMLPVGIIFDGNEYEFPNDFEKLKKIITFEI
ncbi:MAG: hypothetical protein FWD66_06445 [Paludibacter sp.]|nr:hypothetical protein [Paludibacter sp.]